jgi:uncharacterized protein DUF6976
MAATLNSNLKSISVVREAIAAGESLFLAGSRRALAQLPRGNWVGGTISYFMTEEGGLEAEDSIFVTPVPSFALEAKSCDYGADELDRLYKEAPEHGFTFLALPASTRVHQTFAEKAPSFDGFLLRPMVGWVAGVRVDRIGVDTPAVFNGRTGEALEDRCAALHVTLPANKIADLDIVNIFESGDGEPIQFEKAGFHVSDCLIGGKQTNLADFIIANGISTEFPLVGDYNGSLINVSFQKVDAAARAVELYAPVFPGVDYRFAKPVLDYAGAFAGEVTSEEGHAEFACNCILNYLYGKLEGKKTGSVTGPITFGEIAHQVLNQTMVRLYLRDVR